jgi:hypothetical protein
MIFARIALIAASVALYSSVPAFAAEDTSPAAPEPNAAAPAADAAAPALTAEEQAEKDARKACKIKICGILASKDPVGDDVSCDIVKTWREADIAKMLGSKISWPWGKAVCQSKLEVKRETLAKAMSEPSFEAVLPPQKLRCTLAQKDKGEPYAVEVAIAPKVAFANGKAVTARLNWGEASGPMLVYALIYAGTGLDNSTNVLGPEVVRMINEFTTKKCAEVKSALPGNSGN